VHIFSTHFYPALKKSGYDKVKRWTNKIDIFSCDLLLFPIHADDHWSLVAVDLKRKNPILSY
jgi:sentrin-specific protease 1